MFSIPLQQKERSILHIDADAFFASVEQALNPSLKGKAVLVGGPSETKGIVSAASYEAKKYGVYAGMPVYKAKKACPNSILVRGNFKAYRHFSARMYEIFSKYTPDVQMASIDEAYLDITGCLDLHKKTAIELAKAILFDVNRELNISVSCGLASNKTVAKIASSTNKPHKLTVVPFGKEAKFLAPLSLTAMPGIGPRTFSVLRSYGLETIGDLADLSLGEIVERFGVNSVPLWKRARGINNSSVKSEIRVPKSISKERTFYDGHKTNEFYLRVLHELSKDVFSRLRGHKMQASTLFLKIRYKVEGGERALFRDFSFQKHLSISSNCDSDLFPEVKDLFLSNLSPHFPVRLVGVGVSNLVKNYNLNLFNVDRKVEKLFSGVDKIREAYGDEVLSYGV